MAKTSSSHSSALVKEQNAAPRKGVHAKFEACARVLFWNVGISTAPALGQLLSDKKSEKFALSALDSNTFYPISDMIQHWDSQQSDIREFLRQVLIRSRGTMMGLVDALANGLSSKNTGVRLTAMEGLNRARDFGEDIIRRFSH